ncbi:MAG: hypothetical protein ACTSRZ_01540 [Promethearchaeota archaeon]
MAKKTSSKKKKSKKKSSSKKTKSSSLSNSSKKSTKRISSKKSSTNKSAENISKTKKSSKEKESKTENIKKKTKGSRSISVSLDVYMKLVKMKEKLAQKLGGRINFSMVIQSLINDHIDLQNVKKELIEMRNQASETSEYLKNILQIALEKQSATTQIIPVAGIPATTASNPNIVSNINPYALPAQPLPVPMPPPSPLSLKPPLTAEEIKKRKHKIEEIETKSLEVKEQFIKEIHVVFDGTPRKPSEILKITKPKHEKGEIHEIKDEKSIPNIFDESYAMKHIEEFKRKKKENKKKKE